MSSKKVPKSAEKAKAVDTPRPSNTKGLQNDPEGDESSWVSPVLKYTILGLICLISFSIRLFAVARWESVSAICVHLCKMCDFAGLECRKPR